MPEPSPAAPAGAPAERAEIARVGDLLARLTPALDRFLAEAGDSGFPPSVPGMLPSEAEVAGLLDAVARIGDRLSAGPP